MTGVRSQESGVSGQRVITRLAIVLAFIGLLLAASQSRLSECLLATQHSPLTTHVSLTDETRLPIRGGLFLPLVCEPTLADLRFVDPVQCAAVPDGSGRFVVVERTGRLQLVDPSVSPPGKSVLLDLTPNLQLTVNQAEEGLLSIAFHPQFAAADSRHRGELFVYYTAKTDRGPTNRLSRFRWNEGAIDPALEQILIDQPDEMQAHNGGGLAFGPDGFLYVGIGDDAAAQPNKNAQNVRGGLFSGILRIDVDCRGGDASRPISRHAPRAVAAADGTRSVPATYYIPRDNPFLQVPGAREEFYAIGLRNPWRMSFDPLSGRLYVGDPGDRRREEINVVDRGSNCGWAYAEGTLLTDTFDQLSLGRPEKILGRETWPIFEYQRDAAHRCVIGGHVYRGQQFPELFGHYIYADQSGRLYALQLAAEGRKVIAQKLLAVLPDIVIGVSSLDVDADGELLICAIGDLGQETGQIFRLRRTNPTEQAPLPPTLAATGLFADWRNQVPREHLVPYDVNVPLWSDGAEKQRWVAVPRGEQIELTSGGKFHYPAGTVFVKHFAIAADERHPEKLRPLETRVLVVDERQEIYGLTYRFSADGQRTRPVTHAEQETIEITAADGSVRQQVWHYPGRFDCLMCHNDSAGYVLGFVPKQLISEVQSPKSKVQSQDSGDELSRLIGCGVIRPPADAEAFANVRPLVPLDCESAPLQERVRSYLDANCSMCHNPGRRFAAFDTRIERLIEEQGLVEGHAFHLSDHVPQSRIVKSGDLSQSMLYLRMTSREPHLRMPPLGSTVVDERAKQAVAEWIRELKPVVEVAERPTRE